jgi:hypothetical protein
LELSQNHAYEEDAYFSSPECINFFQDLDFKYNILQKTYTITDEKIEHIEHNVLTQLRWKG